MSPTDLNARNWERLCEWMEPKPKFPFSFYIGMPSPKGFWKIAHRNADYSWIYSEPSLDICALAEAEIDRRGLWAQYMQDLDKIWPSSHVGRATFFVRLTLAQRTAAMLAAVEEHANQNSISEEMKRRGYKP